ncbi:MAG: MerR family transcriptional regulator [Chloroflexi bacterium]|nr:MerR family transcriptional regulator [Chloroflexota bacterium]
MMTIISATPSFNLKVIVAETGIKPDTLRAWERRYGLPQPQRTKGKHRLYSQYDLEIIKWLMARQTDGLSISRAVKLWRQLEEEGQNPLLVYGKAAVEGTAVSPIVGSHIEELRQNWLDACHQFDETVAEHILAQAFAIYPPETVCLQILTSGLSTIGEQWYASETTVQQEHFASALATRRLNALIAAAPPPTRRERILVACPPQEIHTFAPLLIALMLRYRGWDVVYLGADVPIAHLKDSLAIIRPRLVILSAQQLHTVASLLDVVHFLSEQHVAVAFGGLIFNQIPTLRKRIPGHFLGTSLEEAPHIVENLINFGAPTPNIESASDAYLAARAHFRKRQTQIETHLWQNFQQAKIPIENLAIADLNMARQIMAALVLGDMDYIRVELAWVRQLIINYQGSDSALTHYLSAYREAADLHLDDSGRLIVDWLAQIIG